LIADARSVHGAIAIVADLDWPPHAVTMRVLDADGREIHPEIKGDAGG
jgi:L-fucose mutarotase/ribose pyranase (RbsD/FucU family)